MNDMLVDGRVPPPDAYNGRVPLWTDATVEAIKQRMIDAPRPSRRQRKTKPAIEAPKPRRPSKTTAHGVEAP